MITKDNIRDVLLHNEFIIKQKKGFEEVSSIFGDKYIILNTKDNGYKYLADFEPYGCIKTNNFDDFLWFIQKFLALKPLPKEKTLEDKLIEAGFTELHNSTSFRKHFAKDGLNVIIYIKIVDICRFEVMGCNPVSKLTCLPHEHDIVFKHIEYLEKYYGK